MSEIWVCLSSGDDTLLTDCSQVMGILGAAGGGGGSKGWWEWEL